MLSLYLIFHILKPLKNNISSFETSVYNFYNYAEVMRRASSSAAKW